MTNLELQKMANEVRKGIVTGVHAAKAGHPGGSQKLPWPEERLYSLERLHYG